MGSGVKKLRRRVIKINRDLIPARKKLKIPIGYLTIGQVAEYLTKYFGVVVNSTTVARHIEKGEIEGVKRISRPPSNKIIIRLVPEKGLAAYVRKHWSGITKKHIELAGVKRKLEAANRKLAEIGPMGDQKKWNEAKARVDWIAKKKQGLEDAIWRSTSAKEEIKADQAGLKSR